MKKRILASAVAASLLLTGCSLGEIKNTDDDLMSENTVEETAEETADESSDESEASDETFESTDNDGSSFLDPQVSEILESLSSDVGGQIDEIMDIAEGGAHFDFSQFDEMYSDEYGGFFGYVTPDGNQIFSYDAENHQVSFTLPAGDTHEFDNVEGVDDRINVYRNSDGTVTYEFSLPDESEMAMLADEAVENAMKNITESDEFPAVVSVTCDADCTNFEVILNTDVVDASSKNAALYLFISSAMYGSGEGNEERVPTVTFVYAETGEVLGTYDSTNLFG